MRAYQCCYTNLLRYDGPYKVGGWTATAFPRDIPPEVLRDCEQFQRADASESAAGRVTDEFGKPLRLYELICANGYAYVIRTRYGMRDHVGRGNNLFSHAYAFPMDDGFLERPETALQLDASCFEQEAGPGIAPEAESAELARRAAERLRVGTLPAPKPEERFDFRKALDSLGLSANRELYKTLLQCVYAHMDAKRESGRQTPLYIQYGTPDAPADVKDREFRQILCCILYGLPHWMRREIRAANWSELDNTPKDLVFTTEDVTRLSNGGAYLVLRTGARNVERRRMARLERCGYLPYAALKLEPERFPAFFAGLDRYAKALGDADAASEAVRKIVWQRYWDADAGEFTERPNAERLERKELISLLSDATDSGLYSMGMLEIIAGAKRRLKGETLTESLRGSLEAWEAEYRRRQGIPPTPEENAAPRPETASGQNTPSGRDAQAAPSALYGQESASERDAQAAPRLETLSGRDAQASPLVQGNAAPVETPSGWDAQASGQTAQAAPFPDALPVWENPAPTPRVAAPLLPVKDWDAVEADWRNLSGERREAIIEWLSQLLDKAQNVPIAAGIFRKYMERQSQRSLDLHLELMTNRRVSGKLNSRAIVRAYCLDELARARVKSDAVRWRAISDVCSVCERMKAPDLTEQVQAEAWELYRRETKPGASDGRAVGALRMYEEILDRLYPRGDGGDWSGGAFDKLQSEARQYYWNQADGNWKYFSFRLADEYEAFDDGRRHVFPMLIRLANSFRPKKAKEFLKQISRFFQMSETPDYFTDENKLRVTGLLYDELALQFPGELPPGYREWMNLATIAEEKGTVTAIQELYEAIFPFDAWKLAERYPRFLWKCKDAGERKARERAYPLVETACLERDAAQAVPLDLWITMGIEAASFYKLHNCFAIFEKKPDAAVLNMSAADVVRTSSLMGSPGVQDAAQAYVKSRSDAKIRKAVQNWLDEASGGAKKRRGLF